MGFKDRAAVLALIFLAAGRLQAVADPEDATVQTSTFSIDSSSSPPPAFVWRSLANTAFTGREDLTFVVKWGLVTAGYSTLSMQGIETINGRAAYHIVSEANSGGMVSAFYKVEDHNEAWLDCESIVSVRFEKRIKEGKYRIEETTLIDQPRAHFHLQSYRLDKNMYEQKEGDHLPPYVQDVLGSLYYVRLLPLVVGQSYVMDVLSGDKVYPLIVKVIRRETINVPAGKFDTFLVEPLLRAPGIFVAKGKKLEVWLTADERRVPVRMRSDVFIGHVSAELVLEPTRQQP